MPLALRFNGNGQWPPKLCQRKAIGNAATTPNTEANSDIITFHSFMTTQSSQKLASLTEIEGCRTESAKSSLIAWKKSSIFTTNEQKDLHVE